MASNTEYISCTDTAKLIRADLKEAFPNVTFSVRSKTYSGGASITIYWENGPTEHAMKQVTGRYEGASFDGMIDLKSYVTSERDGKRVQYGSDYVFYRRDDTPAREEALIVATGWDIPSFSPYGSSDRNGQLFVHVNGSQARVFNRHEYRDVNRPFNLIAFVERKSDGTGAFLPTNGGMSMHEEETGTEMYAVIHEKT